MTELTSRERMLRAINLQETDHVPCCFMIFTALQLREGGGATDLAAAELAMGLDSKVRIPFITRQERVDHPDLWGPPVRFHPDVKVREWREQVPGDFDILHKEYSTPAGPLTTSVQLSADWPHGDHVPFMDDYQIPRAIKPLVTERKDLDALQYLLRPPQEPDIAAFRKEAQDAKTFCQEHGILLSSEWGVGMDMVGWLCGLEDMILLAMDQPDFVDDLLEVIHLWNMQRMELALSAPVDLYIRRGWYEGCDFFTPQFFQKTILPRMKAEADLAHEHGAKFANIASSGVNPLLDFFLEADVDVLIGTDPVQGTHTDMPLIKEKVGHRICLWGGVSGAVTVELGTEEEIRAAVQHAIEVLGPIGLILSPVDNIREDVPQSWRGVDIFIDEWRKNW